MDIKQRGLLDTVETYHSPRHAHYGRRNPMTETKCPETFREVLGDNSPVRLLGLIRQELEKRQQEQRYPGIMIALLIIQESLSIAAERAEREAWGRHCPECTHHTEFTSTGYISHSKNICVKSKNNLATFDTCPLRPCNKGEK